MSVNHLEGLVAARDAYAEAHTTPAPQYLQEIEAEARQTLAHPGMLSGVVVGRLLATLVFALRAQLVVEVGTYAGASALYMAEGLPPGGRIVSCEVSETNAEFARRRIAASPYGDRIEVALGDALETIAALTEPIDFAFIDGAKTEYPAYLGAVLGKLSPHGAIALDNTLSGNAVLGAPSSTIGSRDSRTLAELNERLAADERLVCALLTVRDGVTIVRRR